MAYESKYEMPDILEKILKCLPKDYEVLESAPFSYRNFKKIVQFNVNVKPVVTCERTIKQLYKDLVMFDFISGEEYSRIDLVKTRRYIEEKEL